MYDIADVIEETETHRVILVPDTDAERPMDDDDGWVTSVLVHHWDVRNGYGWQEMRDPAGRYDAMLKLQGDHHEDYLQVTPADAFKRYMRIFHGIEVYDVTIVNGYRDTRSALAWVEPSELVRVGFELSGDSQERLPHVPQIIEIEVAEHNSWAEGNAYGYVVQERVEWVKASGDSGELETWDDVDDCWGFIGREYAEQEARDALKSVTS